MTPLAEHVRITYPENQGTLLRPSYVDDVRTSSQLADITSTPLPTLSPGGVPATPSPAEAGEYVAESVLSDSQIIAAFSTLEKTGTIQDRYLNFTIDSENSTMNIPADQSVGSLANGKRISIRTGEEKNGNRMCITGVGNTFFGLRLRQFLFGLTIMM